MDKRKLRGFLGNHIIKRGSFRMHEIKLETECQLFSVETQSGTIWAACSNDIEVSKQAIIDYLMTYRKSMFTSFMFRRLTDDDLERIISERVFGIVGGGAYYL